MALIVIGYQNMARDKLGAAALPMIRGSEFWQWAVPVIMGAPLLAAGVYFLLRLSRQA